MENNLWEEIVKKLIDKNLTISTMESCTGGGIANKITSISGASSVIYESYVTYSNEAKYKQGVKKEVIDKYTVYSPETAIDMARALKEQTNSDYAIGVTGQLGRIDPSNPVEKLNYAWYAIKDENNKTIVKEVHVIDSNRTEQKEYLINEIAKTLLDCLSK